MFLLKKQVLRVDYGCLKHSSPSGRATLSKGKEAASITGDRVVEVSPVLGCSPQLIKETFKDMLTIA